jgi:hypothetical protein
MTLFEATRDLHHACEAHVVGQRMSAGTVTPQEWADWLAAFRAIHAVIDPHLPSHMDRLPALDADLADLPAPRKGRAAADLAETLTTPEAREAAAYVLHGAHRRGGRVLKSIMDDRGLPSRHVAYAQAAEVEAFVKAMRNRAELADAARAVFAGLLAVMDEIEAERG